jgi:hypothetical protein
MGEIKLFPASLRKTERWHTGRRITPLQFNDRELERAIRLGKSR